MRTTEKHVRFTLRRSQGFADYSQIGPSTLQCCKNPRASFLRLDGNDFGRKPDKNLGPISDIRSDIKTNIVRRDELPIEAQSPRISLRPVQQLAPGTLVRVESLALRLQPLPAFPN
jgi:hypothetical protein